MDGIIGNLIGKIEKELEMIEIRKGKRKENIRNNPRKG